MKILGFLGSPHLNGKSGKLLAKALEGAASTGALTQQFNLIKSDIQYCRGCGTCYLKDPELSIGNCPLKDDMHSILQEYINADGYIFSTPVYDMYVPALMKTFLERMIALTYKKADEHARIPDARPGIASHLSKKASIIVTGNCPDELKEVMGDPCFEAYDGHLMIQQVDTVDRLYVGGVENMTEETLANKLQVAYQLGIRLVEALRKTRHNV